MDERVPKAVDAQIPSGNVAYLDETSFRNFAPLLAACQGYAKQTGCRFLGDDFHSESGQSGIAWQGESSRVVNDNFEESTMSSETGDLSAAVSAMAGRLRAGEPGLCEEVERAFHLVMVESVRNAMIATFRELDMWPPVLKPLGVEDDDCSYEDVSPSLLVIAQRAYNDEMRRQTALIGMGGLCILSRRAATASFLIDFALDVGNPLPLMPETHAMMLRDFSCRVEEWETQHSPPFRQTRDAFMCGLGNGVVADSVRSESGSWWKPSHTPILVASVMLMGPLARVTLALTTEAFRRSQSSRKQEV